MANEIKRLSEGGKLAKATTTSRSSKAAPPKKKAKKQVNAVSQAEAIRALGMTAQRSDAMKDLHKKCTESMVTQAEELDALADESTRKLQAAFEEVAVLFNKSLSLDMKPNEQSFVDALSHVTDPRAALSQVDLFDNEEQAIQRIHQEKARGQKSSKKLLKHAIEDQRKGVEGAEQLFKAKETEKVIKTLIRL